MAEGQRLTELEELLVQHKLVGDKIAELAKQQGTTVDHNHGEDNDCFCDMDLDPSEATDDEDLPAADGGVVG